MFVTKRYKMATRRSKLLSTLAERTKEKKEKKTESSTEKSRKRKKKKKEGKKHFYTICLSRLFSKLLPILLLPIQRVVDNAILYTLVQKFRARWKKQKPFQINKRCYILYSTEILTDYI